MSRNTDFTLEHLLKTADDRLYRYRGQHLQYWEKDLLKFKWHQLTQEQIDKHLGPKKPYYKMSHLLGHKIQELRKELSEAFDELITGSIFIEPFRRQWQRDTQVNLTSIDRFINFVVYADKSIIFKDIEIEVLRRSLEDKTYGKIADNTKRSCTSKSCKSIWECNCRYTADYIGDLGSDLWKKVSSIMGVEVHKSNCIKVFGKWHKVVELGLVWEPIYISDNIVTTDDILNVSKEFVDSTPLAIDRETLNHEDRDYNKGLRPSTGAIAPSRHKP